MYQEAGIKASTAVACYAPLSFESSEDRVVCKTSNFQGSLSSRARGHSRIAKTCRSVGVSSSLAINLNNK